jgi:hypothetical protein
MLVKPGVMRRRRHARFAGMPNPARVNAAFGLARVH